MRFNLIILLSIFLISCSSKKSLDLQDKVEVLRDNNGINHIYANNQRDLFFMQGYLAAKDRLFQFEIWRRQATGTVSEIFGEEELERDIGTRLFMFRGDLKEELNHYHDEGFEIITSYTEGVNAYIREVMNYPKSLPIEFKLLNIKPELWTPADVISRHQGFFAFFIYLTNKIRGKTTDRLASQSSGSRCMLNLQVLLSTKRRRFTNVILKGGP